MNSEKFNIVDIAEQLYHTTDSLEDVIYTLYNSYSELSMMQHLHLYDLCRPCDKCGEWEYPDDMCEFEAGLYCKDCYDDLTFNES